MLRFFFIILGLGCYFSASSSIKLPEIIGSNMVLQRNTDVPLWGWGEPGEKVTLKCSWQAKTVSAVANNNGYWSLKLKTNYSLEPQTLLVYTSKDTITLTNILFGEVWLASGQSNMEWTLKRSLNAESEIENANFPQIRLFNVSRKTSDVPLHTWDNGAGWSICNPEIVKDFSAIAYLYGKKLHSELNVPIGIISSSWGGTGAECWTPEEDMVRNELLKNVYLRWQEWDKKTEEDSLAIVSYKQDSVPQHIYMSSRPHRRPNVLFNGMISPIIPYSIRGVIWYQGTSNRSWADEYFEQMKTLITSWRKLWKQGDFAFYFLQLSAYNYNDSHKASIIRESQVKTLNLKNTAMCPTIDIGDLNNLHPVDKYSYGLRLANIALANTYGYSNIEFCGPLFESFKIKGNKVEITFKHDNGLRIEGGKLNDIYISQNGYDFVPAFAEICKNKLYVYHPDIHRPKAVRYAWNNTDKANLFNSAGLPASPFRTDKN